jgi:GNAT superfamily N-acetyltransferase
MIMSAATLSLADGTPLRLRIGTPGDEGELLAMFQEFGAESRYRRFFTAKPRLTRPLLDHLVAVDRERHVAIAAFDSSRPSAAGGVDGAGVGVVRIVRSDADEDDAEFSIAVIDAYQGRGVGRCLLQAAAVVADQIGIRTLRGSVLAENLPMRRLALSLGATVAEVDDPAVLEFVLDVGAMLDAIDDVRRKELATIW